MLLEMDIRIWQPPAGAEPVSATAADIEAFFRSFSVDVGGYKFDREDANAR